MSDHWTIRLFNSLEYKGYISQPTAPTSLQVPPGTWAWWFKSDVNMLYVVRNDSGTVKAVEATSV